MDEGSLSSIVRRPSSGIYASLLLFYLPLGFSGLMMTLDQPVVNALLNRLPNPDTSVAALRVAFSLALVYEASHISMIDTSTALSADLRVFHTGAMEEVGVGRARHQ